MTNKINNFLFQTIGKKGVPLIIILDKKNRDLMILFNVKLLNPKIFQLTIRLRFLRQSDNNFNIFRYPIR